MVALVFPGENAAHSVTNSTLYHMRYEFMRARHVCRSVITGVYSRKATRLLPEDIIVGRTGASRAMGCVVYVSAST